MMNQFAKYGMIGGSMAGMAYGIKGQADSKKYDPYASTSVSSHLLNGLCHVPVGMASGVGIGMGIQEIAKRISKS